MTLYETVQYPNHSYPQTHPSRLATIGLLHGLQVAPPEKCRVLEIGCGNGTNLLSLAALFPNSHFTGIDLAASVIAEGLNRVRELGLTNIELIAVGIEDFQPVGGPYDYVIAHGVYSWVPAGVRDAILAACRKYLVPAGIAYISYNCYPGCHVRQMIWEMMRFHTRAIDDPAEKIGQAMAITRFIASSFAKTDTYRQLFKDQLEQIQRHGPGHLFHDDLAEINDPVYFHEFAAQAAAHGMQYVAEADLFETQDRIFSEEAREALAGLGNDRLTREQYSDFIKCRRFRQTLLCRAEYPVQYPPGPKAVPLLHASCEAIYSDAKPGSDGRMIECFTLPKGGSLEIDLPSAQIALRMLSKRWPATVSFPELCDYSVGELPPEQRDKEIQNLAGFLFETYCAGFLELRAASVACHPEVSERPKVWSYARWQASRGSMITTLRGDNLRVDDAEGREMLQLLDGTRTLTELQEWESQHHPPAEPNSGKAPPTLADRVKELARMALLEA